MIITVIFGFSQDKIKPYKDLVVDSLKRLGPERSRSWTAEVLRYRGEGDLAEEVERWSAPQFPVTGHDLMSAGCPKGRAISAVTSALRGEWKGAGFETTKEELLKRVPGIVAELGLE